MLKDVRKYQKKEKRKQVIWYKGGMWEKELQYYKDYCKIILFVIYDNTKCIRIRYIISNAIE